MSLYVMESTDGMAQIQTYLPLYRKYRPQQFSDLVGQQVVSSALGNAITQNHMVHAYLFCGPRGTGKTSTARIMAKSLNCQNGPTVTPCQTCPACVSITAGNALDVTEIDAASNNGVEDMRELLERVSLAAMEGRYKIYIIDEVHMLSASAFNALLKTLEEPPPNVVFIFATTEPHKVLPTIISRCQRFDFARIDQQAIEAHLTGIAAKEAIHITPEAIRLIARHVRGGLRDALGMLDQVAVLGLAHADTPIDTDDIMAFLGELADDVLFNLTQTITEQSPHQLLACVHELMDAGAEPAQVVNGLLNHMRSLLVLASCAGQVPPYLSDRPADLLARMQQQASAFAIEELPQIIHRLAQIASQLKHQANPVMWLEVGLLEIAHRKQIMAMADVQGRLEALEARLQAGGAPLPARPAQPLPQPKTRIKPAQQRPVSAPVSEPVAVAEPGPVQAPLQTPVQVPVQQTPQPPATPSVPTASVASAASEADMPAELVPVWQQVLAAIDNVPTHALVSRNAQLRSLDAQVAVVAFSTEGLMNAMLRHSDKQEILQAAFAQVLGHPIQVHITVSKGSEPVVSVTNQPAVPVSPSARAPVSVPPAAELSKKAADAVASRPLPLSEEGLKHVVSNEAAAPKVVQGQEIQKQPIDLSEPDFEEAKAFVKELLSAKPVG